MESLCLLSPSGHTDGPSGVGGTPRPELQHICIYVQIEYEHIGSNIQLIRPPGPPSGDREPTDNVYEHLEASTRIVVPASVTEAFCSAPK
ncbi:hypothetical protein PISMIDRAFT_125874 [Pisolithus microcarpus 441]|uniref:Uncharacterized protein n=1 Tax=Pisolithus microcarpus 441 TaxID=765257 RepID=A0A0C9ZNG7_9AGAM|nr:hypothetical protein PISMIDRAFT_125874 [Pisolithus microcarpus 441]